MADLILEPIPGGCKRSRRIVPGSGIDGMAPDWESIYPAGEVVYFVQCESGPIKIGYATNLRSRLNALQTGNHEKLRLLGWIEGGRDLELFYHERYRLARIRGEWFKPFPLILSEIALVAEGA